MKERKSFDMLFGEKHIKKNLRKMAALFLPVAAISCFSVTVNAEAEEITVDQQHFPDPIFREYISQQFDTDGSSSLSKEELENAKTIDFLWGEYWVTDMTGIEYFTSLESLNCSSVGITELDLKNNQKLKYLDCTYNSELTALDISYNVNLEELHCYETGISELSVSSNSALRRLDCNNTNISSLDVSNNKKLFALNCENTNVSQLDLSHNPELYEVYVTNTPMTQIDVTKNPELVHIRVSGTGITELNLKNNPKLAALYCSDTGITQLDLSGNPQMYEIFCYNTPLEKLDLTSFAGLHTLECYQTNLKELNVSKNPGLVGLNCSDTEIRSLDVTKNTKLQRLECKNTQIQTLDLGANKQLRILNISDTNISNLKNLDLSSYLNMQELYCENAGIESLNLSGCKELYSLRCGNNHLTSLDLSKVGDLWYEKNVSPQTRTVYANVENDNLILDMNQIVGDLNRVSVPEGAGYSYDAATGKLTAVNKGNQEIVYTYNHGYTDLPAMEVKLKLQKAYTVSEGKETEITKGNDLEIKVEGNGNKPEKVSIDGNILSEEFYTIEVQPDGSVTIKIKQSYLNQLIEGKHYLQVWFQDGRAESVFIIKNAGSTNPSDGEGENMHVQKTEKNQLSSTDKTNRAAKTGDQQTAALWIVLMCGALFTCLMIQKRKVR